MARGHGRRNVTALRVQPPVRAAADTMRDMRQKALQAAGCVVAGVLLLATNAACSASTPTRAANSWQKITDKPSGFNFALPHRVAPKPRKLQLNGATVSVRFYYVEAGGVDFAVTAYPLPHADQKLHPQQLYDALVAGLHKQGSTDATLSDVKAARVQGQPALDANFQFTASTGKVSYWRLRTITTANGALGMAVLSFNSGDTATRDQVDSAFARLIKSVTVR
jgi:hypothetical protein